jgi:hypothetical protein
MISSESTKHPGNFVLGGSGSLSIISSRNNFSCVEDPLILGRLLVFALGVLFVECCQGSQNSLGAA